ncbi:MAG TPA: VWA domain-containing protein, partial [Acidimicrobiales bacterium]|nr:VWA domain-containing protein [Acidimicrobiales bacterium]
MSLLVALLAAAVGGVAGAAPAAGEDLVSIRAVDATDFPEVRVTALFTGEAPDLSAVAVREQNRVVPDIDVVPAAQSTRPAGVVLVVDTSGSMEAGGKLVRAQEAARRFVSSKAPGDAMALVAFSNEARIAVNFTNDASLLTSAIDSLTPSGETALWDAVRLGAGLFADQADLVPYLLVLSDGADTVSATSPEQALGAVEGSGAGVFPIALTGGGESDAPALRRLADASGGIFLETTDPARLDALYARVQRVLSNQYEITWTSEARVADGVLDVSVKLGDAVASASVPVRAVGTGAVARPEVVEAPSAPGPLSSSKGAFVVAGLVALTVACFGAAVVSHLGRDRTPLGIVEAYTRGPATGAGTPDDVRDLVPEAVRRAVEATARLTGGGGLLDRLEGKLDAADVKVRPQEFVVFHAAAVLGLAAIVALAGAPALALAAGTVVTLVPVAALNLLAERRRKAFTGQLPDALQLLASSLR